VFTANAADIARRSGAAAATHRHGCARTPNGARRRTLCEARPACGACRVAGLASATRRPPNGRLRTPDQVDRQHTRLQPRAAPRVSCAAAAAHALHCAASHAVAHERAGRCCVPALWCCSGARPALRARSCAAHRPSCSRSSSRARRAARARLAAADSRLLRGQSRERAFPDTAACAPLLQTSTSHRSV
jgi:hypothetical protein